MEMESSSQSDDLEVDDEVDLDIGAGVGVEVLVTVKEEESMCRACLATGDVSVLDNRRAQLMALCTGLPIARPGDGLPLVLCNRCVRRLSAAATFRRTARRTHNFLSDRLISTDPQQPHKLAPDNPLLLNRQPQPNISQIKEEPDTDYMEHSDREEPYIKHEENSDKDIPTEPKIKSKEKRTKCTICDKSFSSQKAFKRHLTNTHESSPRIIGKGADKIFQCPECPYSTPKRQTFMNHFRTHTGERPHKCDQCDKCFTQLSALIVHKRIHTGTVYKRCRVCHKRFKNDEDYFAHKNTHPLFYCTICNKGLKTKNTLADHMNRHNNIKNYSCDKCGANFVTYVEILNHAKKSHATDRAFACHLCSYRGFVKSALDAHLLRHAGQKAFGCDICNTAYCTNSELTRHRRIHSEVKIYSCGLCQKGFRHRNNLSRHAFAIHGIKHKFEEVDRRIIK